MFPLAFLGNYAPLIKTAVYALLAILAGLLGINYIRRGQQNEANKKQIKELNTKLDLTKQNTQIDSGLKEEEKKINEKNPDDLLRDINNLHK